MATKELRQALSDFAPGFTQSEINKMDDSDIVANLHDQLHEMDREPENATRLWSILKNYCFNCGRKGVAKDQSLGPQQPLCQRCIDGDFGD